MTVLIGAVLLVLVLFACANLRPLGRLARGLTGFAYESGDALAR